jgi:uncharacterized protein DUF4242
MNLYVILRRDGWSTPDELEAAALRSTAEGERRRDIQWIRSYVIQDGDGLGSVCIYRADGPDALRQHAVAAGLPVTDIAEVADTIVVRPDPEPVTGGPPPSEARSDGGPA